MKEKVRALISVYDKQGIVEFAKELEDMGIEIISSGGTAKILKKADISVKEVSEVTGFPEMLDGRVKTLHPKIHAGILANRTIDEHMKTLQRYHIKMIDVVVVNLYPFERTIEDPKVSIEEVIENIDIGGPTLIRAAAKNYRDVLIVTSPDQYQEIVNLLKLQGISRKKREELAIEAFSYTAQYDAIISNYLRQRWTNEDFPKNLTIPIRKTLDLRYGENPHQKKAALYENVPTTKEPCIANARKLQGKELSYNNVLDADSTIKCIRDFIEPTCVIVKHNTPCGIASAKNLLRAWENAFATDIESPFGGIVAFNRRVEKELAEEVIKKFLEVIIAPSFSEEAKKLFSQKPKIRLLEIRNLRNKKKKDTDDRGVGGGHLRQEHDIWINNPENWKVVSKKKPTKKDLETMEFAVKCIRHVKSNSVLFAKDTRTIAIGGGQTSRIEATRIAIRKGGEKIKGSIMVSDAFFPFPDCVILAVKAKVRAFAHPGGSKRDQESIDVADRYGAVMVFTGQRYFKH